MQLKIRLLAVLGIVALSACQCEPPPEEEDAGEGSDAAHGTDAGHDAGRDAGAEAGRDAGGDSGTALLCVPGLVEVTADITADTVWDRCLYVIKNNITVSRGANLVIWPDVVVKFDGPYNLMLQAELTSPATDGASLSANGSAEHPIVFTSFKDDSAGGDSNGDGAATRPAAGDWSHIVLASGTVMSLKHATVRYGDDAVTDLGATHYTVVIEDSTFEHNAGYGADLRHASVVGQIIDSVFRNNDRPLRIDGVFNLGTSNTFENNARNAIFISGFTGTAELTTHAWQETEVPFVLDAASNVEITRGHTLGIGPGVVVKLPGHSLQLQGEQATPAVAGAILVVSGTVEHPVIFTSLKDDSVGGDSNGDGATTAPARADWYHIGLYSGSRLSMSHATVRYGNDAVYAASSSGYSANLDSVRFEHNAGYAVDLPNAEHTSRLANCTFADNEKPLRWDGAIDLGQSNAFSSNDQNGIFVSQFNGVSLTRQHVWDETEVPFVVGSTANVEIPAGHALTVMPDVAIKLLGYSLQLQGAMTGSGIPGAVLEVSGTSDHVVHFTSLRDDAVKGDTDGDSGVTAPARSDWNHIGMYGGSTLRMRHAAISYGDDAIYQIGTDEVLVQLDHVTLLHNANHALRAPRVLPDSNVTNCHFADNAWPMMWNGAIDLGVSNSFGNNDFNAIHLREFDGVASALNHRWEETDVPFVTGYSSNLEITAGHTLTIAPGVVVKLDGHSLHLMGGTVGAVAGAIMLAQGMAENPVVFTSFKDDTAGGDTNHDGTVSAPLAGDWYHLGLYGSAQMTLQHAQVRYGSDAIYGIGSGGYQLTIAGGEVAHSAEDGIDVGSGSGSLSGTYIHHNAGYGINFHTAANAGNYSQVGLTFDSNTLGHIHAP
ncbi:MAG: hypothetical protein JXR83_13100 [Deltaproteobacteria bacterium]|nr:hypothetical protein [Deltaproteobacteria bacterium]